MKYLPFLLILFLSCCHDYCNPEESRCQGDTIQICNSEEDWYDVQDCTQVTPGLWECCESAVEYEGELLTGCVPLDTCAILGGDQ